MLSKLRSQIVFVLVCAMCFLFVSCQNTPKGTESAATELTTTVTDTKAQDAKPELKGKIVAWVHHNDAEAALYKEYADSFKKINPNVEIDFQTIPYDSYWDKLNVALESKNGPDIFRIPANVLGEYHSRKQILPIPDDLYTGESFEAAYSPNIVELLRMPDGKFYGMPSSVMPDVLIINNKMFSDIGLNPQTDAPKTWSEFRDIAKRLTVRDDKGNLKIAGASIMTSPYQYYWTFPIQNCPIGVADAATRKPAFANDDGYNAWKFLTDLILVDKVDSPEFKGVIQNGTAAMVITEYVVFADLKNTAPDIEFSIHLPPYPDGKKPSASYTSWAFTVSAESKSVDVAWRFIDFMDSEENQKVAALKAVDLPSRMNVLEDPELSKDANLNVALEALKIAKPYNAFGWDDVWYIEQAAFESIVLNGTSVKAAVDEASQKLDALYAKKFTGN
ncbi:MAG: hypothetical protein A2Y21_03675 [Clostridiales bacterium GWC2_40_7]|nr:MAG: hypothetical protein A2Y21_03675 [Clostridiales bacterium GWC2_40_7]